MNLGNYNKNDVDTVNSVLSLAYGLIEAHKVGYPLRPVISILGSPTKKLEELLSNIIRKSITISKNTVKKG